MGPESRRFKSSRPDHTLAGVSEFRIGVTSLALQSNATIFGDKSLLWAILDDAIKHGYSLFLYHGEDVRIGIERGSHLGVTE